MNRVSEIRHLCHIIYHPKDAKGKENVKHDSPAKYKIIVMEE